jgi:Domain of unknown function (DUF4397)
MTTLTSLCRLRPLAVLALSTGLAGFTSPAAVAAVAAPGQAGAAAHVPAPTRMGTGYLRLAYLSPDSRAVDVYLYSFGRAGAAAVFRHVNYGTISRYRTMTSGDYTVAMRRAGAAATTRPVLSATLDVTAGDAYTVAGLGPRTGPRFQVITDRLSCPPGRALIRVIQASLRQPRVSVTFGGRSLARDQAVSSVTPYRVVRPGTYTVRAAGASERAKSRITLAAGSIDTLLVFDRPGHLAVSALKDAAGSSVVPHGAAATGFGGTAPKPGGPALPWLVLAAAGMLLLTVAGVTRIRQIRWARRAAAHLRCGADDGLRA